MARISANRLDDRYQLFFKGGITLEARDAAALAETRACAAFERTPAFRRLLDQRNGGRFELMIERYARLQRPDPALLKAVIAVESSFEPAAVSANCTGGSMQIIAETGERFAVMGDAKHSVEQKLRDPAISLRVGTR